MRRAALLAGATLALAGCGGGGEDELVVSAAASLERPLTACARDHDGATVRLQFAGSDELAAQIRQGLDVDVFAAANTRLPEELAAEGRLERPVEFASNRLVLALPADASGLDDLTALAGDGVQLAIGAPGTPVGDYTRGVLGKLGPVGDAILANVRSEEPDVKGVIGKLLQGAADAGFVYATDVEATGGRLRAIELPEQLEPTATYGAGVVKGTEQPDAARAFVAGLARGACHDALLQAGFGEP